MNRFLAFCLLVFALSSCGGPERTAEPSQTETAFSTLEKKSPQIDEYGIVTDSLVSLKKNVKRHETLADILTNYDVPYIKIVEMAKLPSEVFDERRIKAGSNYALYLSNDSAKSVRYFIYQKTPIDYIVFNLSDSLLGVTQGQKPIVSKTRTITGTIEASLYETLIEQGASPMLALKLADVFAWQIDFYGIQKGDYFKAIFEEQFIDDESIGVGEISAAYFYHNGKDYYAFDFDDGKRRAYYDEEGNSLQKQFLRAPLHFSRISSHYSRSRFHPVLRIYRPHLGIDYAAPTGTPVRSVGDGVVVEKRWSKGGGRTLKIRHNSNYQSGYLHLSGYAKGIVKGARVKQGQVIGYVGSTGLSTGPHLDFRFWKHGRLTNYLQMEFPPTHPVNPEKKGDFMNLMAGYKSQLDKLEPSSNDVAIAASTLEDKREF
ncbi:Peptidase M23 [Chloroherpeton thalassium ATCC 35110]|uniref:Peptidase M23 n=2 Tax=Chloroherpeton thalassium TaxID=100716 RepID=B3QW34_CHLT3|nr:Peptidase M23 [Chloroherpeton thalassium ATCC 35110]